MYRCPRNAPTATYSYLRDHHEQPALRYVVGVYITDVDILPHATFKHHSIS